MNTKFILSCAMVVSALAFPLSALADNDVTAESAAQNTPSGWTAVSLPTIPTITTSNTFTITDYGASTSSSDNTTAIQSALNAVPSTGGMVVVPAGTWLCGPLTLKAKTVLHLAKGATLKLLPFGTYPGTTGTITSSVTLQDFLAPKNKNVTDLIIEGEDSTSVIDGQGQDWWELRDKNDDTKKIFNYLKRGAIIRFNNGSRFLVRNLKIQNSPGTNITVGQSGRGTDVTIHDVIIREPASEIKYNPSKGQYPSHNTDGIPVWSSRVNVYNCNISNGDDNVVIDANGQYVHVWNCQFGTGHGASVGSFTGSAKHILFDGITFKGTSSGIRLKSNKDRGGGEDDFVFSNITMTDVDNPFSIDCYYDKHYTTPEKDAVDPADSTSTTPTFKNIVLRNVKTTDTSSGYAIFLYGRPESHIKNITLDNVQISAAKGIYSAFVDSLVFKNDSKITVSGGNVWVKNYLTTYDDQCNATSSSSTVTDEGTYTLSPTTLTSTAAGSGIFSNGFTITNGKSKTYDKTSDGYIKYSAMQHTISIPSGLKITKMEIKGRNNYTDAAAGISEVNGTSEDPTVYTFPTDKSVVDYSFTFSTPVETSLTFTVKTKQIAADITLYTTSATGIDSVITLPLTHASAVYDLQGRMVGTSLQGLPKGLYIQGGKKVLVK
ncbi:MAG: glycosyl hydrolase family 28 protein [Prevotellaceae bacterium]|nr:glycosyl hydrolase family 28 protein [Prevotellaceae bacterium]